MNRWVRFVTGFSMVVVIGLLTTCLPSHDQSYDNPHDPEAHPDSIPFEDDALRQAVLATGASTIQSITTLDASEQGILQLDGIEYLLDLVELDLSGNFIEDVTVLGRLTSLRHLSLADNEITTGAAELVGLSSLEALDLTGNENIPQEDMDLLIDHHGEDVITGGGPVGYSIGDVGPAGGWIFYVDVDDDHAWTYLEAAPEVTEWGGIRWGDHGTEIGGDAGLSGIGDGQAATEAIVQHLADNTAETDRAAQLCDALSHGGYDDWFLPSRSELLEMYDKLHIEGLGNFNDAWYWSSSESNNNDATNVSFATSNMSNTTKQDTYRVRAIRAF